MASSLGRRLVQHLLTNQEGHLPAIIACLASFESDRRLHLGHHTSPNPLTATASPTPDVPSCSADLVLKLSALAIRILAIQRQGLNLDPLRATASVFDEILTIVDVASTDRLMDLLNEQRRQTITRLCRLVVRHLDDIAQPHLNNAADKIMSLVEGIKADAISEYLQLRGRLAPLSRESLARAILDGTLEAVFDELPNDASGDDIRSRFRTIRREFREAVDTEHNKISEMVSPVIHNLPSEIQTHLRELVHRAHAASAIVLALSDGRLLADFRTAASLSTPWFIGAVSRLAAALSVDTLSEQFSPAHAAVVLLTSLSWPVEDQMPLLELPLHLTDRVGVARGILALTILQPPQDEDDMSPAAARQQLGEQVERWKARLSTARPTRSSRRRARGSRSAPCPAWTHARRAG